LDQVYPLFAAKESGRYEIHVTDANGFTTYRNFDLLPDVASKINPIMSTSLVETGENISTHLVTILDQYDNPANGEIYTLEMSLIGGGLVFDTNGETTVSYNIVDGYKAFRLRSTDVASNNTLRFTLKNI